MQSSTSMPGAHIGKYRLLALIASVLAARSFGKSVA